MTGPPATHFKALSFGDLDGQIWGGALDAGIPAVVYGIGETAHSVCGAGAVRWARDGRGWRLSGQGFDLHMEPSGEDLEQEPAPDPGMTVSGLEELCRVQGTVSLAGAAHPIDCVGTRWTLDGVDLAELGSLRAVSGWFAADNALAVLALRDRRARGHETDLIAATLFDPAGGVRSRILVSRPPTTSPGCRRASTWSCGWATTRTSSRAVRPPKPSVRVPRPPPTTSPSGSRRYGVTAAGWRVRRIRARDLPRMTEVTAIISDFGGVLTSPLLGSFEAFREATGISPQHLGIAMAQVAAGSGSTRCSSSRPAD